MMKIQFWMVLTMAFLFWTNGQAAGLKVGDPAPSFNLLDQNGEAQSPERYRGGWLVLYFYPKDDTPGCTAEACAFRDDVVELGDMGVSLLGVSTDDVESHQAFAEKYHLPFPLLSDADGKVAAAYGSLVNLGFIKFAKRHSFIIDPQGKLAKIYRDVDAKIHSDEIIAEMRVLLDRI